MNNAIPMPPPQPQTLARFTRNPNVINNSNSATLPTTSATDTIGVAAQILNEQALRPNSVINLTNSNDVVIGPMTQYQGAVTIYQYMDATVEALNRGQPSGQLQGRGTNLKDSCNIRSAQTWILILLIAIIVAGSAYFFYTAIGSNSSPEITKREILFGKEYEDDTIPNLGNGHLVIDRKQWGAGEGLLNPNNTIFLKHPIPYVIITHVGVQSRPCSNVYNCSVKMRSIQDAAIAEKGNLDISANFYVSQDGYVYVGLGWNITNIYTNNSLAVCFMGDYMRYHPSAEQFDAVQYLLSYGVARRYIAVNYRLVAHSQVKTTKSPGIYVYNEIVKWPRWYPCGKNNITCDF